MINALRKRFIVTAMLSLAILLALLIAAVTAVSWINLETSTDRALSALSSERMTVYRDPFGPGTNSLGSLKYFTVIADYDGEIALANIVFDPTVSSQKLLDYTETALESGGSGRVGSYKYLVTHMSLGAYRIVFLDISQQTASARSSVLIAVLLSLACAALMLVIVTLVSGKAVQPIARSMEKQRQFVTDAGHEIKTPLAIILANTEALELHSGQSKWSGNIRSQAQRLGELMEQLLNLSRLDEGEESFSFEDTDISALAVSAAEDFGELAAKRGCRIDAAVEQGIIIRAYPTGAAELMNLLLDNAVKYCSDDSVIYFGVSASGKKCTIELSNTCDLLPDAEPEALFDRFYRADTARTQSSGGSGIGLSAASAIAELHKGSISASYADEHTIKFTVALPLL